MSQNPNRKDLVIIDILDQSMFKTKKDGLYLSEESKTMKHDVPQQVDTKEGFQEMAAAAEETVSSAGAAMLAISLVTSSAAVFISFIGFSEVLAFLPMINLNYPPGLVLFFRGISGMNFQLYDIAEILQDKLGLSLSINVRAERFDNAGFEF